MRIAITILGVLVVAVVGGGYLLSRLIAAEELRAEILEEGEALTGGPLQIDGRVDLTFLPRPTLSFSQARFAAPGVDGGTLEVDRVDLGVGALALLAGEVEIESVHLVRPRLTVTRTDPAAEGLLAALAAQTFGPVRAGLAQLSVVDGRALIHRNDEEAAEPPLLLERIDIEVGARSEGGPFSLEGSFAHGGETYALETRLGRLTADPATTVQITLGTSADSSFDLQLIYRGVVALDTLSDLRGQIRVSGDDLGRAARTLTPAGWSHRLAEAPRLDLPFDLEGEIESERGRGRLTNLRIDLAGRQGEGSLGFDLAAGEIALSLALPVVELAEDDIGLPALTAVIPLTDGLTGTVDLSVGRLVRRGAAARDARLGLDLDREDGIVVRQLHAVLPGDTDLTLEGRLRGAPEAALDGRIAVVTDRLGETLAWLDLEMAEDALQGFRSMSLASGLVWTADTIRLEGIDGRLDASRIEGDLEIHPGERPTLAADLAVDRLSLPPAVAGMSPEEALAVLVDGLSRLDLDLDLEVGRLLSGGLRLEDLIVRGRAEGGRLALDRLAAAAPARTVFEASGVVDAGRERLDLDATVTSDEPGPLLRRLGLALPVSLARLGPLRAEIATTGWLEAATIVAKGGIGALTGRASGDLGLNPEQVVEADLDVEIVHPRYPQLIRDLGLAGGAEEGVGGPLTGAGKIRLDGTGGAELIGHLALGGTRITGQIARSQGSSRASHQVRISLGEPRLAALLPLAGLAGYRLDGITTRPLLGAWPRHAFDLDDLAGFDGRVMLSGKGGAVGEGLDALASSTDGRLVIENAVLRLPGGEIGIKGEIDAGGPVPRLALTIESRGLALGDVLESLGIAPGLSGRLDLFGRLAGVGDTPYDLVRSLRGDVTFSVKEGTVSIPAADSTDDPSLVAMPLLEGRADVWRGTAELTRLDIDTADGLWQGEGRVDLLLWIIELTLRNADDDRRIRIVGRPGDPQVRSATLEAAAPVD